MSDLVTDRTKKQKQSYLNTKNGLVVIFLSLSLLFSFTTGCRQQSNKPPQQKSQQSNTSSSSETQSIFKNTTIEFANEQGETLGQLEVEKAVYSPEGKTVQLEGLTGNLFENGEIVLKVTGKTGTIENNGEKILLEEDIVARDRRNNLIIRSEKAEWRPKEDVLILQENLNASHPNLKVTAKEGIYLTKKEQLELKGKIIGITKDPPLQMRTEHVLWQVPQEMTIAPQSLQIDPNSKQR
ncbi:MAG: LPS export ABC transporter periplasmic protein LptC [Prochloron sp. SP5CPC1]|nr:LPS export ABC transporter periplasmic protein LptC [Candidatus Paraprochloron terpiosi SP5CPC1]